MSNPYIDIESISVLHELYGCGKPKHPLVTLIDLSVNSICNPNDGLFFRLGFYTIFCKKFSGILKYGKSYFDFNEGSLIFLGPGQVISHNSGPHPEEGWGLFFHPDLLNRSVLGSKMHDYSFFNYEANEALHISEDENIVLKNCVENIKREYSQAIDRHTNGLIQNNIELFLNNCNRFYDRQFHTREKVSSDIVQQFEKILNEYFAQNTLIDLGIPKVKYFSEKLNLSPNYLSDLLNKFTGKSTQEYIHLQLVDKAKALLWGTDMTIGEVAYKLGFEHQSHFTKIFKSKTDKSPSDYRRIRLPNSSSQ